MILFLTGMLATGLSISNELIPITETTKTNQTSYTIDLKHLWSKEDWYATYAYNHCMKDLSGVTWKYSCKSQLETRTIENTSRKPKLFWPKNKNGTTDWWLCQLNSAIHWEFILSKNFNNPYTQLDYCHQKWLDSRIEWWMPRYGHRVHDNKYNKSTIKKRDHKRSLISIH